MLEPLMEDALLRSVAFRVGESTVLDRADRWPSQAGNPSLTKREMDVFHLVSKGLANKAVAGQLGVTEGTVKVHLHHIFQKLHISNRTGLILSAISNRQK